MAGYWTKEKNFYKQQADTSLATNAVAAALSQGPWQMAMNGGGCASACGALDFKPSCGGVPSC
jgi:hypothetical protein